MKRAILNGLLVAVLFLATGCMTFEIEGDGLKTPRSKHGIETVHGSYYGFSWKDWKPVKSGDMLGLYRVNYTTNVLYALVSIGSFGLYVPQDVEWWCQAPQPSDDEGPSL